MPGTYRSRILHHVGTILTDDIRRTKEAAEKEHGCHFEISKVALRRVAEDPREVYDVVVTLERSAPEPPENADASI